MYLPVHSPTPHQTDPLNLLGSTSVTIDQGAVLLQVKTLTASLLLFSMSAGGLTWHTSHPHVFSQSLNLAIRGSDYNSCARYHPPHLGILTTGARAVARAPGPSTRRSPAQPLQRRQAWAPARRASEAGAEVAQRGVLAAAPAAPPPPRPSRSRNAVVAKDPQSRHRQLQQT